jgi:hypothetical protein
MASEMKLLSGKMHPITRHAYEMHRVLASALGQLFTRAEAQWQTDLVGSLASCGWVSVDDQLPPENLRVYAIHAPNPAMAEVLRYDHGARTWRDWQDEIVLWVTHWHTLPPF